MAAVSKPIKGKKIKVVKEPKAKGKRGRPAGSINIETIDWLEKEKIDVEVYKKILSKIKS